MVEFRDYRSDDLDKISIQKEQRKELSMKEFGLDQADKALTIYDDKDIIAIIWKKRFDGMDCICALISDIAGKHMLGLVRMLGKLTSLFIDVPAYFFVRRDFKQAHRLARIMNFTKRGSKMFSDGNIYDLYLMGGVWQA